MIKYVKIYNTVTKKKVGVIGYSKQKFDKAKAKKLLRQGFRKFDVKAGDEVVSGLTDLGIPAIAYRLADEVGATTIGIVCKI